jgi:hypothetical protein
MVITYDRSYGQPANVLRVEAVDGGFRHPNHRDLELIRSGDMNNTTVRDRMQKLTYHYEKQQEQSKRRVHDDIRHATLDGRRQLEKAILQKTNTSKANATFRRIDHKPSKRVVATA